MKKPGLLLSLVPVLVLIALLMVGVSIFGDELTGGPSQIAIFGAAVVTALIGLYYLKVPWRVFEEKVGENLGNTSGAIIILLSIGALTATWMLSGIVPTMIYYGLKLIHPKIFIVLSFLLCAVVSLLAGSSWTTVGTIGVALFGAGTFIGIPTGWLAGAIISGAYLGDKVSPLSDTTNLSASIAGVNLYTHVRYTLLTTFPALIICLVVYGIVGFVVPTSSEVEIGRQMEVLQETFHISGWYLLVPVLTIIMILKKVPPMVTLFLSALAGGILALFVQPQIIDQIVGPDAGWMERVFGSLMKMMSTDVSIETGDPLITRLASTHGMGGMVNTVWIIIAVMLFGGCLTACGMVETITAAIISRVRRTGGLVTATILSCIFCNLTLSDQFMAILLPGNMFRDVYKRFGLAPEVLSRTLEDSGTVSSVLVPWNTCAVVQSSVLGVATMAYFPFAIFCFITPLIAITYAAFNIKIHRLEPNETTA
ncbi:MAG: sodium:proton antiporter [Bacteroidales bacterium]|nr:sodium:proton antiporter [Bacteroidales bacterium]